MAFESYDSWKAYDHGAESRDRGERSDEETAAELFEIAIDAQAMAQLLYCDYRCYRDRDGYPHILQFKQERCALAYARARALYEMWLAEVAS